MKYLSLSVVGVCILLGTPLAVAQPAEPAAQNVAAAPQQQLINGQWEDIDVVNLLRMFSDVGNLNIIIRGDVAGNLKKVQLQDVSPAEALQKVARAADLSWKIENKTYIISSTALAPPPAGKTLNVDIELTDTPVAHALKLIGDHFKVKIIVSDDITEKLRLISLRDAYSDAAIQQIATAANLVWRKDENNNYFISKPTPDLKPQ